MIKGSVGQSVDIEECFTFRGFERVSVPYVEKGKLQERDKT